MCLIKVRNISYEVDRTAILSHISFNLQQSEFIGLLGPSGCGKSTLVRIVLGLLEPTEGTIRYSEQVEKTTGAQPRYGYVPTDDVVHKSLTVELSFYYSYLLRKGPGASEDDAHRKVKEILTVLDLTKRASQKIKKLSGGGRKRVNLGIELLTDPLLLFLDEPTSGLDPPLD